MASSSTPKLGFPQYDAMDDMDYSEINAAFLSAENEFTPSAFTTASRPTGADRWDGRVILDTDLGKYLKWNASQNGWRSVDYNGDDTPTLTITPATGMSISGISFTHKNGIAQIYFGFNYNQALSAGDFGNTTIGTISDSKWWPKIQTALSAGASGPTSGLYLGVNGAFTINSISASVSAGFGLSAAGMWILT